MPVKEITLEEAITKFTERLASQKESADANIAKLTQRASEESDPAEKTRLEGLVQLHTEYRAELDQADAVAQATEWWNRIQARG